MPICTCCQADKPDEQFHKCAAKKSGRKSQCKVCRNLSRVQLARRNPGDKKARDKRWDEANPVRRREISLGYYHKTGWTANLKKRGVSESEYLKMFDEQGGVCKICGGLEKSGRRLAVDHCHTTGKVRGLLCRSCNCGLGHFKDLPTCLRAAAAYLEKA